MTYTQMTRDRYRLAVTAATGVTTAGALTATGWLGGLVAADFQRDQVEKAADQTTQGTKSTGANRAGRPTRVVYRERPVRTRVAYRYLTADSGSAAVGTGGSVSTTSTSSGGSSGGNSGGNSGPSSSGGSSGPAAPPTEEPAPSSGS
jgi:hypothetical protein